MGALSGDPHRFRAPLSARSAQFNLFPLPSIPRADRPNQGVSAPLLARPVLGHTVKELPSRGLKSRSGGWHLCLTSIDVLSLGRPSSWRPAKLSTPTTTRQPISSPFFYFFSIRGGRRGGFNEMVRILPENHEVFEFPVGTFFGVFDLGKAHRNVNVRLDA